MIKIGIYLVRIGFSLLGHNISYIEDETIKLGPLSFSEKVLYRKKLQERMSKHYPKLREIAKTKP